MISKSAFLQTIELIQREKKNIGKFNDAINSVCSGYPVVSLGTGYLKATVYLLSSIFGDADPDYPIIEWWLFDESSKRLRVQSERHKNMSEYSVNDPGDLYDCLVAEKERLENASKKGLFYQIKSMMSRKEKCSDSLLPKDVFLYAIGEAQKENQRMKDFESAVRLICDGNLNLEVGSGYINALATVLDDIFYNGNDDESIVKRWLIDGIKELEFTNEKTGKVATFDISTPEAFYDFLVMIKRNNTKKEQEDEKIEENKESENVEDDSEISEADDNNSNVNAVFENDLVSEQTNSTSPNDNSETKEIE